MAAAKTSRSKPANFAWKNALDAWGSANHAAFADRRPNGQHPRWHLHQRFCTGASDFVRIAVTLVSIESALLTPMSVHDVDRAQMTKERMCAPSRFPDVAISESKIRLELEAPQLDS